MKHIKQTYLLSILFGILFSLHINAQKSDQVTPEDDLGNVTDVFQENFFEALKQRAIENYELALTALKKAEKGTRKDPVNQAVINLERAKNYVALKKYDYAEEFFLKTIETVGEKPDIVIALYELYQKKRDYKKAIVWVKKIVNKNIRYKEDLTRLYINTKQYTEALSLLDELDTIWGESAYRDALRKQVYRATGTKNSEIDKLVAKINKSPKTEKEYLNLIYLYSEQGDSKKAFETAKELLKNNPASEKVHLALYKFYIEEGTVDKAVNSINIIAQSQQINTESKYRVLDDFLSFLTTHPQHQKYLEPVVERYAKLDNSGTFYFQLGQFFLSSGNKEKALQYLEKGLQNDNDNYKLIKTTLQLQLEVGQFKKAQELSKQSLELFPSQPDLYLYSARAFNSLKLWDKAIESLELGLDFVFENPEIENQFYKQFAKAYLGKGNTKKSKRYLDKTTAQQPEK